MATFATAEERTSAILAAHKQGKTIKWMRREWKVAYDTVNRVLVKAGLAGTKHKGARIEWTEERKNLLTNMWMAGESLNAIAAACGCSRRGFESQVRLLGLPPKQPAVSGPARSATSTRRSPSPRRKPGEVTLAPNAEPSLEMSLMDLQPFSCRWITDGAGADAKFCGHTSWKAYGYCAAHHAIAYIPKERETRRARTDYQLYRRAA